MATKKDANSVKIKKGATEKTVSKAQWDAMKKSNSTYGWNLASDLPKDVTDKDAQIELSKIAQLENSVKDANAKSAEFESQVKALTSDNEAKDAKIAELQKTIDASNAPAKKK